MSEIWNGFRLESLSFWIGFLTGILFVGILRSLLPKLQHALPRFAMQYSQLKTRSTENTERQYRDELYLLTQNMHLASAIFPLDEILVEPCFLFSNYRLSEAEETFRTLTDRIIPYMPDWPELAAFFQAEFITTKEILDSEANIAILGHPGTGKTVALAHIASMMARRDDRAGKLSGHLPVYIHIPDLIPGDNTDAKPIDRIINLIQSQFPRINSMRLKTLISNYFKSGKVVLLLDGFDELPSSGQYLTAKIIKPVLDEYPETRFIASADVLDFSGLKELHPIPVTISPWTAQQRQEFLTKWINNWLKVTPDIKGNLLSENNRYLLTSWLLTDSPFVTPFETTLKVWAITAGDLTSPSPLDCIDLFVKRFLVGNEQILRVYEELAVRMVSTLSFSCDYRNLNEISSSVNYSPNLKRKTSISLPKHPGRASLRETSTSRGILICYPSGSIALAHPAIASFLAAKALSQTPILNFFESQPDWMGKRLTLGFLKALRNKSSESLEIPEVDPLSRSLLSYSRWLHFLPNNSSLQPELLKILAVKIQQSDLIRNLRLRFLAALLCSQDPGLNLLFRSMVKSGHEGIRGAGLLGLGFLKDESSLSLIEGILTNNSPDESGAACLALSMIGSRKALELLGTVLLSGEEKIKVLAALALSNHYPDGHEMLKEGSQMKDFLIRRAIVFGLVRISEPWAKEVIEKLAVDDDHWLVRDIASQALDYLNNPKADRLCLHPELSESPWLIEFASSKGVGVSPGKPAMQMLYAALRDGNPHQKRSALEYLRLHGEDESLAEIINCLDDDDDLTREAAFDALWHNLAMGLKYPFSN